MQCDCQNDGCTAHLTKHVCRRKARIVLILADYLNRGARNQARKMCYECAVDYAQLGRIVLLRRVARWR